MTKGFAILQAKDLEQFLSVNLHLFGQVFHQQSPSESVSFPKSIY